MSNKHTPGPWFINRESSDCQVGKLSIEVDGDYFIAQVDEGLCQEANARLIAASPMLLYALQEIVAAADGAGWSQLDATLAKARAAIAKATGGAA